MWSQLSLQQRGSTLPSHLLYLYNYTGEIQCWYICQAQTHLSFYSFSIDPDDYTGFDTNIDLDVGVGQPGDMRFCVNIAISPDLLAEGNEEFTVNLQSLNSALVAINPQYTSATVEIVDDDSKLGV